MNIVIMGCGRVGAQLASILENEDNTVTVVDTNKLSFRRLPPNFKGIALLGDGTDQDILKKAGIQKADAFIAVTEGDNRNVMAAQIAKHLFKVPRVMCRIYDPLRKDVYEIAGIEAISPTTVFAQILRDKLLSK
jgi:trk system potassium uptake protein TrkA